MFVAQWRSLCLLFLTCASTIIFYSSPNIVHAASIAFKTHRFSPKAILADSSLATNKQNAVPNASANLLQQLNLTAEQQQKIKKVHQQYKQRILKKRRQLATLQQQLSDMMVGAAATEAIRTKNQQLVSLRQEIGTLRFETMLATREILTLPQRQKFRELVESQGEP